MNTVLTSDPVVESEQCVIGAILIENTVMDELISLIDTDDFSVETHGLIWRSMKYLYQKNEPIDLVTVATVLDKHKKLDAVGGVGYLTQLASSVPSTSNVVSYAEIIKRQSLKRKGMTFAEDIRRMTMEDDFETNEEYLMLLDTMFSHMRPDTTGKMKNFAETKSDYLTFLTSKVENVTTGFKEFDEWSGGVGKGWLYILAGRPSIGKTAKALQMASHIATLGQGEVLVWSQEMSFNQLKNRVLSSVTGINYGKIRKKLLEPHELEIMSRAHDQFDSLPLSVEDSYGVNIEHIRSTARQMKRQKGSIGAIVVDYLTRMDIQQKKGETWSRAVGEVAKRFKWLAQEMNCPVILLAQLNREGAEGAPSIQNLRDSGEIEQEADIIEFLWQDPEETSAKGVVVQSTIAKGRDIGTSKFKYLFKGWIQKYEEYGGGEYEVANIQSYQEGGSTYRKIPNKSGSRSNFPKRNA